MEKRFDVVAIGELLIDFTPLKSEIGKVAYERNPGGAPANVLVAAEKLGNTTAIISKVGNDIFGRFLKSTVEAERVDTRGLVITDDSPTTLAFVTLDSKGDRTFEFFRKNSADVMLSKADLDIDLLNNCRVLHFGSVSLTDEPSRSATVEAVCIAKKAGAYISYDPNYRSPLWKNQDEAVRMMREALLYADIVKVADDEIELITGESEYSAGARKILEDGAKFVFVTLGRDGCYYAASNGESGYVPGFEVNTVDATGAGDCFTGCVLNGLINCNFSPADGELLEIVKQANAAGALSTTKRGAIPAMPERSEIEIIKRKT